MLDRYHLSQKGHKTARKVYREGSLAGGRWNKRWEELDQGQWRRTLREGAVAPEATAWLTGNFAPFGRVFVSQLSVWTIRVIGHCAYQWAGGQWRRDART